MSTVLDEDRLRKIKEKNLAGDDAAVDFERPRYIRRGDRESIRSCVAASRP